MTLIVTRNLAVPPHFQSSSSFCTVQLHPRKRFQSFHPSQSSHPNIFHGNLPGLRGDCADSLPIAGTQAKNEQSLTIRYKYYDVVISQLILTSICHQLYLKGGVTSALPSGSKPRRDPLSEVAFGEGAMADLKGADCISGCRMLLLQESPR